MVSNTLMQAILAMDAYNQGYNKGIDHGETQIGLATFSDDKGDTEAQTAGFYAVAYNYDGQTVISYRGTDNLSLFPDPLSGGGDIWTGWGVGLGSYLGQQALLAAEFYQTVTGTENSSPLEGTALLVGHSMGGGLAGLIASIYHENAVIFDNIPFEEAATNLYETATLTDDDIAAQANLAWIASGFNQSVYDQVYNGLVEDRNYVLNTFYNGLTPWSPLIGGNIGAYAVTGEAAQFWRATAEQTTSVSYLDSNGGLRDIEDLHSQSLLVHLQFAQDEGLTDWHEIGKELWDAAFSEEIGEAAGFKDDEKGHYSATSKLLSAIAYSAIDEGNLVFGDTGIRAMFDDADQLGKVLSSPTSNSFLGATSDEIAQIFVQYAGILANYKVSSNNDILNLDPETGIIDVTDDNLLLSIDLSSTLWTDVFENGLNGGAFNPISGEITPFKKDEFFTQLFTQNGQSDIQNTFSELGLSWSNEGTNEATLDSLAQFVWGAGGRHVFDRVNIATKNSGPEKTLGDRRYDTDLDKLSGNEVRVDVYAGVEQNDKITGTQYNELIFTGKGTDEITATGGRDFISGGEGEDTIDYSSLDNDNNPILITVDQAKEFGAQNAPDTTPLVEVVKNFDSIEARDLLHSIEIIEGTQYIDSLIVNDLPEDLKLKIQNLGGTANEQLTDIIYAKDVAGGVEIKTDASGNGYLKKKNGDGGTIEFENLFVENTGDQPPARVTLTDEDDIFTGSIGTVEIFGGAGDDEISTKGVNNIIYAGIGNDFIDRVGEGTRIFTGQGEDKINVGHNTLATDASNEDRFYLGGRLLTGGLKGSESESPWAYHAHGFKYGINHEGQLVISHKGNNGFESFVSNYEDGIGSGVPTANITIAEFDVQAGRLVLMDVPDNWIDENFRLLDIMYKAWFGEERKPGVDPLVLDLDGDGLELRPQVLKTPSFDLDGDNFSEPTGWVLPDDGFLALDSNNNGQIDGIHELFGSATQDGFDALAAFDSNQDGVIDASDTIFADLRIWQDHDTDAVTDAGELKTLADFDITSINLAASDPASGEEIIDGNRIAAVSSFTRADGTTSTVADVVLTVDNFNTTFMGDTSITPEAALLPGLKGHGVLPDLRVAMSRDDAFRALVETQLPSLDTLDLDHMRGQALTIFTAWASSSAAGSVASANTQDIPILTYVDDEGKTQINDFGIYDPVLGAWALASGKDVLDDQGQVIAAPTADDIRAIDPADLDLTDPSLYSWDDIKAAELNFYEHYIGEPLALGFKPVDGASLNEVRSAAKGMIEQIEQTLDILSVRLAVQGPLKSFFEDIEYSVENDNFYALTDRQLAPTFEDIIGAAQTQGDPIAYIEAWERVVKLVMTNFDRGEDYLKVSQNFVFANIVAAHEALNSNLDILDVAEALGVTRDYIVTGSGEINGTSDHDIFYLNEGDQVAKGGSGFDVYVVGKNFGNDVIEDIEQSRSPDIIRFADIRSTEVTATREGEDLIISVNGTNDTLRVVRQFEGEKPGLFGGYVDEGTGVQEVIFVDGVVWDPFDIAKAASHRDDASLDIIGTDSIDYLDGGAGDDRLEGGGDGDVYYFDVGYGHDTILDELTNVLVDGDDYLMFGEGLTFDDVTFSRQGDSNTLDISINGTTDKLTIEGQFWTSQTGPFGIISFNQIELFWFGMDYYTNEEIIQEILKNVQTDGDDEIYGFFRKDTLDGGIGNDFLSGGEDSDVYYFGKGYGQDIIEDNQEIILTASNDKVIFKSGVSYDDLVFTRTGSSDDLIISFVDDDATLTLRNQFNKAYTGLGAYWFDQIETFEFEDDPSTVLTWDEFFAPLVAQEKTDGNDEIYGFDWEDTLDGGLGDDFLSGGNENDIYIYGLGYGHDVIDEKYQTAVGNGEFDIVQFGDGITSSDLTWTRDGASNDVVAHLTDQDTLTIKEQFGYGGLTDTSFDLIEEYHFTDGTILTAEQLRALLLEGTDGDDVITGYGFNDTLDGGLGNDRLVGRDGSDTYKFDIGYGQDVIYDHEWIVSYSSHDVVEFGSGIIVDDLVLSRNGSDLVFSVSGTQDTLTIEDIFYSSFGYYEVEEFRFADGNIWTLSDVQIQLLGDSSTDGDDIITGFRGDDTLEGGLGNDTLYGDIGSDTYIFNLGDGQDTIHDKGALGIDNDIDVIQFGQGIAPDDVTVTSLGVDIILSINGTTDQLTLAHQQDTSSASISKVRIEEVRFENGVIWTEPEIIDLITDNVDISGDDLFIGTSTMQTIDGGQGVDTIDYSNLEAAVWVDLEYNGVESWTRDDDDLSSGAWREITDLISIENIIGTNYVDYLAGDSSNNYFTYLSDSNIHGTETINGRAGNDTVDFSNFNSAIWVDIGGGGTEAWTRDGIDVVSGTWRGISQLENMENIIATDFHDEIYGDGLDNVFEGGLGNDTISGKDGADNYRYSSGDGNDIINELNNHIGNDQLIFTDLNANDVTLSVSASDGDDMLITINDTNEVITIDEQFYNSQAGIEQIVFADSSVLLADDFV